MPKVVSKAYSCHWHWVEVKPNPKRLVRSAARLANPSDVSANQTVSAVAYATEHSMTQQYLVFEQGNQLMESKSGNYLAGLFLQRL